MNIMKKLVLLSLAFIGSSYAMNKEDQKLDQQIQLRARADKILDTPEHKLKWRCPDCGTNGPMGSQDEQLRCRRCKKVFRAIDIKSQIKSSADAAIMRLALDDPK